MNHSKIVFGIILIVATIFFNSAPTLAEPVLIKLLLEKPGDYERAISLGVVAYQRIENLFVIELEDDKLKDLDEAGLQYQIIDEHPWDEAYLVIFLTEGTREIDWNLYGEVMLLEKKWQIIKTSPEKAAELIRKEPSVVPILHQPIPLRYSPQLKLVNPSLEYSQDIDDLVNMVSSDSLRDWIQRLQKFYTRCTFTDSIRFARQWIYDKFKSFGLEQVKVDTFYYYNTVWNLGWHYVYNIRAVVPGTIYPERLIVVGAHYDSYGSGCFQGDPNNIAPGADDDASGTSAVMELARIIYAHPLKRTVIFIAFDSEEPWMDGSYSYVQDIYNQGIDLDLMINLDMIGYTNDTDPDVTIHHGITSVPFGQIMAYAANSYTWLRPVLENPSPSDSWPFYEYGYTVLYAEEGDFNTVGYHTPGDTLGILNIPYMTEVTKMGLATLLYVANFPSPAESLKVKNAGDGHTVYLSWSANPSEEEILHYKVYFGTSSGHYDSVHQTYATFDTLRNLEENTSYFVGVTATSADSLESAIANEVSVVTYHFTLDQGILLVDETYDQPLSYNFVNGDSINAFYARALQGYAYTYVDHSYPNGYPQNQLYISELLHYSPVIIHSADNRGMRSLAATNDSTYLTLKAYLDNGGKVIIEGRRNLSAGNDGDFVLRDFHPGEIPYDYLKIKSVNVPLWSPGYRSEEFIGAQSQDFGYPDLSVDSLRVAQSSGGLELLGRVPGVGFIDSLLTGEVIYRFNSDFDTSNSEGRTVAFRYLGSDYSFIYFDFPLYFIQEAQACSLLHRALSDLGMYPSTVEEDQKSHLPLSFSLKQNFPNPFNLETVIEYFLPQESRVQIAIYNLLGQRVKVLVNEREPAGNKKVSWDGRNGRGEAVSSGIYFYRIEADEFTQTKRMVLLK
ncbi:MAG TPA: M28 family peptidase [candidate division Zixibacteria bacterium]